MRAVQWGSFLPPVKGGPSPRGARGTYYFRTYVPSEQQQEVRLWAAGDERFQLWLNGVQIRDGWGWNYTDDGRLCEKVSYATLEQGVNTLVLELLNSAPPFEFPVRFCDADGSGRQPGGVTAFARRSEEEPLQPAESVIHDFKRPRFHAWSEINDMPWTKMPRLGEAELRELTGIEALRIRTHGPSRLSAEGVKYESPQHLFLDVPAGAVTSPWIEAPAEDSALINNDLDYNWKSLAWLRVPGRPGPEKSLLLLRFDVAEPLLNLLKTEGRPAHESLVGWMPEEHKPAYVALVNLPAEPAPRTALDLLVKRPC